MFFSNISDATKNTKAIACFIFVGAAQHAEIIRESLKNNLHTYCVKPIAINKEEFKKIYQLIKKKNKLQFLQGYNNQWNEAATSMYNEIISKKTIGKK